VCFYPFVLHEISVLIELTLGHLRYYLTDVPPQPNSPPDHVINVDRGWRVYMHIHIHIPPRLILKLPYSGRSTLLIK
jgi:hypothetical protein